MLPHRHEDPLTLVAGLCAKSRGSDGSCHRGNPRRHNGLPASEPFDAVISLSDSPDPEPSVHQGRLLIHYHVAETDVIGRCPIADHLDGRAYAAQSFWWSSSQTNGAQGVPPTSEADLNPWPAPFDQPFYLIMNVAVGGRFLGNPDAKTAFPVEMSVDYVRVYEKAAGYGSPGVRGAGKLPFQQ